MFTFGITAETKSGVYPTTFTFAVKRNGGFDHNRQGKTMIAPKHDWTGFDFEAFNALAGGNKVSAKVLDEGSDNTYIFAEYNYKTQKAVYKVWEKADGGDGVYHVYDEVKYASTGGYGPILFAYISSACEYLDRSLTTIEMAGNNSLTVSDGTENYKQFIEGFEAVASSGFYCVTDCPCHSGAAEGSALACTPSCTSCTSFCTKCPEELMNKEGYAQWCNADGVAPVTPELKDFLQNKSL